MFRVILGVIFGYVVMFIAAMGSILLALFALGVDFAYEPGRYDVTLRWLALNLALSLLAAVVGGFMAGAVGGRRAANLLAALALIVGLVVAVGVLFSEPPAPAERPAGQLVMEAWQLRGRHEWRPLWYDFALPFVGAAGAFLGGRLNREPPANPPAAP